jgi:hypothetical protein
MLLVTTTMGMVYGVHGHTSNLGPLLLETSDLVVNTPSFQDWLVSSGSTSNQTFMDND